VSVRAIASAMDELNTQGIKTMSKGIASKTSRRSDEKPHGPVPDDSKSQATCNEEQRLVDEQGIVWICGEDDYYTKREDRLSRLKEALGIDDRAFCEGLLQQLYRLIPIDEGPESETDFNFVLSFLKSPKPVDKPHAVLLFQMAVGQLCATRQAQILLKPINYELPCDVAVALHRAAWDTRRMEPQRIKLQDQPVRQMGERMFTRLTQTYALQLQISVAYRKAVESLARPQVAILSDGSAAARRKKQKVSPARSSRGLNGSQQHAAGFTDNPKQLKLPKSNGRAPS
jgi:hypothetical protein